jgi:hypothetical protein
MLSGYQFNGFDILTDSIAASRQASGILMCDRDFQIIAPIADLDSAEPIKSQPLIIIV